LVGKTRILPHPTSAHIRMPKRKGGRPKLPPDERRGHKIQIAVNAAELRAIDGRRKSRSRSAYIRGLAVHGNESSLRVRREAHEQLGVIQEAMASIRRDYIVGDIVADDLALIAQAADAIRALIDGRKRPQ
jgi:hypothetical protein